MSKKEEENDCLESFNLNIFNGLFRVHKIKQAIKNGEKTARNYAILSDWYSIWEFIPAFNRKTLYYALKAVRADRKYPKGYCYAGIAYLNMKGKEYLCEKYYKKAYGLGGVQYYRPLVGLFVYYMGRHDKNREYSANMYKVGTAYLKHENKSVDYWADALCIISFYYGFGFEYKRAFQKIVSICKSKRKLPGLIEILTILTSVIYAAISIIWGYVHKSPRSTLAWHLFTDGHYEQLLALLNKILIRENKGKNNNRQLAMTYLLKAQSLIRKGDIDYEKAIDALEQYKKYCGKKKLKVYYLLKANFANCAGDYKNALIYANEALLYKVSGGNLYEKGVASYKLGNYVEAQNNFQRALKYNDCDKAGTYDYLALTLYMQNKYEEAVDVINKALLITGDRRFYYSKAMCLEALGKDELAKKYYKKYEEE
ncbi:MAG: tetratricopeptide repeat protein [bacterium]|nr:tetratricopeptide repeat protein [bacterium]